MRTRTREGYPSPGDRPFLDGGRGSWVPEINPTPNPVDPRLGGATVPRILCEEKALSRVWQMRGHGGLPASQPPHPLLRISPHRVPLLHPLLSPVSSPPWLRPVSPSPRAAAPPHCLFSPLPVPPAIFPEPPPSLKCRKEMQGHICPLVRAVEGTAKTLVK